MSTELNAAQKIPSRYSAAVFVCKAALLQARRCVQDRIEGVQRFSIGTVETHPFVLAESITPLWTDENVAERALQQGKVQNLRIALRRLNGTGIPAGSVFSFWKQIGRPSKHAGYVLGRQLREGCLYPAIGGGLCQLSNALYDAALNAGCSILERHRHSARVPGSMAGDRDATVAFNYIDLRFEHSQPILIEVQLTSTHLIVRIRSTNAMPSLHSVNEHVDKEQPKTGDVHDCTTCGIERCFRHRETAQFIQLSDLRGTGRRTESVSPAHGRTAYLVDECWPEFREYLQSERTDRDMLGIPIDGERRNLPRYAWDTAGYARVRAATWPTLYRSIKTRRLGRYGARRVQAQLDAARLLANCYARSMSPDVTNVSVDQSLLPFLWRGGHLGGRTFDVMMVRLPLNMLHDRLDAALQSHPDSKTLGEIRAPQWMVDAETQALAAADRIVTPHREIASLFPGKSLLLDWKLPPPVPSTSGASIVFPGPTAARKGAYELRDAARALDIEVVLMGSELEGGDFWAGVRTRRAQPGEWLKGAAAVVQPSLVEDKPRMLLAAIASGVPVIATAACGLGVMPGVTTVPFGDADALTAAIETINSTGNRSIARVPSQTPG